MKINSLLDCVRFEINFASKFLQNSMNNTRKFFSVYNAVKKRYNFKAHRNLQSILFTQSFRPFHISGTVQNKDKVSIILEMENGNRIPVITDEGSNLRDVIADQKKEVGEFYGVCEGSVSCSTCHIIFNEKDYDRLSPPSAEEIDVLDIAPNYCSTSRLACSITLTSDLNGIVVKVPDERKDARQDKD